MTYNDDAAAAKCENDKSGRLAGTGAGVIAGAQLGTVLLPIPVVGTFTGALVGGLVGNKIGKRFGGAILDKMDISDRPSNGGKANMAKDLERLRELHDAGVLTDEEFKAAKAKLLGL
ncbi:MAG: SHOCT domain-containing protein [Cyanobacteria bacterium SZAS LIN-2]|nr:SHOCT domain-containing protein [Cyanobacteria bacterium SZAS LIN-2]MBS2008723.1 SHOCT domain-containing protein [Cyanobacteria bacterium SZAS TMP-1]